MAYQLIYSHDDTGNAVDGNLADLVDAVSNGKSLRVLVEDDIRGNGYIFDSQLTSFVKDGDVSVCAQNSSIISNDQDTDQTLRFKDKCYRWLVIACTKGYLDITRYFLEDDIRVPEKEHTRENHTMKWFVDV